MPEAKALQSATIVNAEVLEMANNIGQIKKGYYADIIAVDGDPLKDITILENVSFVMKDGNVHKE